MRRLTLGFLFALALAGPALAQAPAASSTGLVVTTCGATAPFAAWVAGQKGPYTVNTAGQVCFSGSVSASISGFAPATQGTPVAATTGGNTQTLPAGTVVVATNVGTTNAAYCKLGASSDTGAQYIAPNGGWFAFTVGAATQMTCVTSTSTTTVNQVGGAGLPTGTGGGGGGSGGGGAITAAIGSYASGALSSGSIASGAYASGAIGSGAVASGAFASGSIGSGAVASGAYASGSIASGAIAAGAQIDLLTMRGTKAPGTAAANSMLTGAIYTAAGITLTDGQQAALQFDSAGNVKVSGIGVAIGSTTSGQTGSLVMGATTTGAPSYTTAQTNPLSLDTAGNLRTIAPTTTNAGAATVKGGIAVVNGGSFYQAVAASQTATVLQSSTGAAGDYLSHCDIYPTSTSPGVVTVFDNANAAATNVIAFPGGASSLSNLVPFPIPVGAVSTAGAWKVTTGANVSVVCYGKFS
jgi:hypothetical protein